MMRPMAESLNPNPPTNLNGSDWYCSPAGSDGVLRKVGSSESYVMVWLRRRSVADKGSQAQRLHMSNSQGEDAVRHNVDDDGSRKDATRWLLLHRRGRTARPGRLQVEAVLYGGHRGGGQEGRALGRAVARQE